MTIPTTHKECTGSSGCGEIKLKSAFTKDKSKRDGHRNRCKQCQREYNRTHVAQRLAADKRYREKPESRFKKYKASAKSRGFLWDLTRDQFMKMWKQDCSHCGGAIKTIGIDRIDSSLPYREGNIEPCCSKCNQMKSDWSTKDWVAHMVLIVKHKMGI